MLQKYLFLLPKRRITQASIFANLDLPPFFNNDNGEISRSPAFCSSKWKRDVFTRFVNKNYKEKIYNVLMGFSTDEKHRAARMKSTKKWQYKFPLLELQLSHSHCISIIENRFNAPPPRSSCFYCPNHTRDEWRNVMQGPDKAILIKFDESLRKSGKFLTHDCLPISQVDFDDKNESIFSRLCSGGCFL